MTPYYFKRTSRGWPNLVLPCVSIILLILAMAEIRWRTFNMSEVVFVTILFICLLTIFFSIMGFIIQTDWELDIDEHCLIWKAGKQGGGIRLAKIKKVGLDEFDDPELHVITVDGKYHKISNDCFGDADKLRTWLHENLGDRIEVCDRYVDLKK